MSACSIVGHLLLVVAGGRDFLSYKAARNILNQCVALHGRMLHIECYHSGRKGADELTQKWCVQHSATARPFMTDWDTHGDDASTVRNQQMIDEALTHYLGGCHVMMVAFPGGKDTHDLFVRARAAGLPQASTRVNRDQSVDIRWFRGKGLWFPKADTHTEQHSDE